MIHEFPGTVREELAVFGMEMPRRQAQDRQPRGWIVGTSSVPFVGRVAGGLKVCSGGHVERFGIVPYCVSKVFWQPMDIELDHCWRISNANTGFVSARAGGQFLYGSSSSQTIAAVPTDRRRICLCICIIGARNRCR